MMRHCNAALAAGLTLLLLAGCGSEPPAEMAPGQEPYLRYCASCHGNDGAGRPPAFPPLAGSEWLDHGPEATALITLYGLRGEIEVAGQRYRGYMPPMRHIGDQDIAALLGFIGRTWGGWAYVLDAREVGELRDVLPERQPLDGEDGLKQALEVIQ